MQNQKKRITLGQFLPSRVREALSRSPTWRQWRNRLAGRAWQCTALRGESIYNICINCDMTVSCNCRDYDGTGHIGDLRKQSLKEIFSGSTARRFRETLAAGRFPTRQCTQCWELRSAPRATAAAEVEQFHPPASGIMVENTVRCNLRCIGCAREEVTGTRTQMRMSLEDMEEVARNVQDCGIETVAFHNLGEPFLSPNIHQELSLLRKYSPKLRLVCSTNGIALNTDDKREAALLLNILYMSLDGPSQEIAERYQQGVDFDAACRNLEALVRFRDARGLTAPLIEWKYVVFAWNDQPEHIEAAVARAREIGADLISFWSGGGERAMISRNFPQSAYFQNLGNPSWKGREVILR